MRTVAFDLDGTLIDSVHHIHTAVGNALRDLDLPALTLEETRGFVGRGLPVFVTRMLDHQGLPATLQTPVHDRIMAHYTTVPSDPASIFPGVLPALEALRAAGLRLTLCTNKPTEATAVALRDLGLDRAFDLVIAGGDCATRKPEPEMLQAALAGASRALFVGDSEVDAETAQRAEVAFALYTEGYRKTPVEDLYHTARFSDFADLPALALRLLDQAPAR